MFKFKDLTFLNSSGVEIEGITGKNLCYLDQGILIQILENTSEPASDWTATGDYVWSSAFCGYIN